MRVSEVMTSDPVCCAPSTPLQDVARLMVKHDCGEIPVVTNGQSLVGVITDRDITVRTVAVGRNPLTLVAEDCMSAPVVTVAPDLDLDECLRTMEANQIRRVPVVDASGNCCGIIAQADIARKARPQETAEVVREVSQPREHAVRH